MYSDLNAYEEKLRLLKEVAEKAQSKHEETVNQLKKDFIEHVKLRESQL